MIKSKIENTPMHIYYDISLKNTATTPIIAKLFENRTSALIENPREYYYSCVRFQIPTAYLPIFIYPNNGLVANNTAYSVGIKYNTGVTGDYRSYVIYVPFNNTTVNTDPAYFFVYSFQQFVDAINTAFNSSFTALKTANAGATVTTPPFITFDASTGLFSLNAETAYSNANYEIFMNTDLYGFFDNFEAYRYVGATNGKDVKILVKNNGNNTISLTPPPSYGSISCYQMTQEYKSLFNWFDVRSLVFVSNTVGVADEAINVINSETPNTGNSYQKILTDFQLNTEDIPRSYIQYVPTAEYRLIDLTSSSPLYLFDVQIFFKTGDQQLYPLYILPQETIDIKNLFRNKMYNNRF